MDASIFLYTFKEGLLSKLAHDLRLSVTGFEIRARGTEVSARLEVRSIRVDGVMKDGKLLRTEPSESDKAKIQQNMLNDVLRASEHAEVKFVGRTPSVEPPFTLRGELTLGGTTRAISTLLMVRGDKLIADLEITPSQWGIKPYRALGGTLKVQDRIRIAIAAAWPSAEQELNPNVELVWTYTPTKPSVVRSSLRG
ncbi:MAG TPA: YceI family protein [Polyangiales bacterium]|nr:YceI family protein [Polyangiales bacterium]